VREAGFDSVAPCAISGCAHQILLDIMREAGFEPADHCWNGFHRRAFRCAGKPKVSVNFTKAGMNLSCPTGNNYSFRLCPLSPSPLVADRRFCAVLTRL